MSKINEEVCSDISIIIGMMPKEMKDKISNNFIDFIENNKSRQYVSNINPNVPINQQGIKKETKEMLGMIYRDYLCLDDERIRLQEEDRNEIKKNYNKLQEKYQRDNLFIKEKKEKEKRLVVVTKEKWYKKIFRVLKKFLGKK